MAAGFRRPVSSRSTLLQRLRQIREIEYPSCPRISLACLGFFLSSAMSSPLTSADDLRPVRMIQEIWRLKEGAEAQMDAEIIALSWDLAEFRTGRASAGMLDHIIVEVDGVKMSFD